MTRIDFYHYAEDKVAVACRLAAKAHEASSRLVVYASDRATLERFDRALWEFHPTKFVPHCFLESKLAAETPVILATSGEALPHHDVLLNLDNEWPPFFATFERLLEVVSTDEGDKNFARARYVFYNKRGYAIQVVPLGGDRNAKD